jgi:hypothetical protein
MGYVVVGAAKYTAAQFSLLKPVQNSDGQN